MKDAPDFFRRSRRSSFLKKKTRPALDFGDWLWVIQGFTAFLRGKTLEEFLAEHSTTREEMEWIRDVLIEEVERQA